MAVKNIVFDLGNVLMRFDQLELSEKNADNDADRNLLLVEVLRSVEWIKMDRGTMTCEEAAVSVCKRLPERLHDGANRIIQYWEQDNGVQPIEGMEDLIKGLKKNGYKTYLLSNAGVKCHDYYNRLPACTHLDGVFISADWYVLKPSETIYRTFCAHFSLEPAECFFIDDMAVNIEGAMNMGMNGFVFRGDINKLKQVFEQNGIAFS